MIHKQERLARRYAQAFLNVYGDLLTSQSIQSLAELAFFLKQHIHACFLMELSFLSNDAKEQAVRDLCHRFKTLEGIQKLFLLLISHQRSSLTPHVFDAVIDFYRCKERIIYFSVSSACELSDHHKKKLEDFLCQQVKGVVVCSYVVDKKLIAGIRLQSDNWFWQDSVRGRLRALQQTLRF